MISAAVSRIKGSPAPYKKLFTLKAIINKIVFVGIGGSLKKGELKLNESQRKLKALSRNITT